MTKWINDIFYPKRRPYRCPTVKLGVEVLEGRTVPSTLWTDGSGDHEESNKANWSDGLPNALSAALFDPSQPHGSDDWIEWNETILCDGIIVQNEYLNSFTMADGVTISTSGNFSVSNNSSVNLSAVSNSPMIKLINGAAVTVASDCFLTLQNNGQTGGVTFFQGDTQPAGEILNNSGEVDYVGSASAQGSILDNIKIPVLNNGLFIVDGGLSAGSATPLTPGQGVGSSLLVWGSDAKTGNVSWYQNNANAVTNLKGDVILGCQLGYTQTSGILESGDSQTENLTVVNNGVYGTVNINGGKVQANPNQVGTPYGILDIYAKTVNLAGEIDEAAAGDMSASDLIHMNGVSDETLNCEAGARLDLSTIGQPVVGKANRPVLQFGSIKGQGNLQVNIVTPGLKWKFNPIVNPTEIDVYT